MAQKMTFEEAMANIEAKYPNKFDFSKAEETWVNTSTYFTLICKDCGYVNEKAKYNRLMRPTITIGCPICSCRIPITLEKAMADIEAKFPNKFDFSKMKETWKGGNAKHFTLICKDCGYVNEKAKYNWLMNKTAKFGCLSCAGKLSITLEKAMADIEAKYPNKFDFSKMKETWKGGADKPFTLICKDCGYVNEKARYNRLMHETTKFGCLSCAGKLSITLEKAMADIEAKFPNKFDFSKMKETWKGGNAKHFTLICKDCGYVNEKAKYNWLMNKDSKCGCSSCFGNLPITLEKAMADIEAKFPNKFDFSKMKETWKGGGATYFTLICKDCGYVNEKASYRSLMSQRSYGGCAGCVGRAPITLEKAMSNIEAKFPNKFDFSKMKETWKGGVGRYFTLICKDCGYENDKAIYNSLMYETTKFGCPICAGNNSSATTYYTDKALEILTRSDIRSLSNLALMGILAATKSSVIKNFCKMLARTEPDSPRRENAIKTAIKDIKKAQQNHSSEEELASILEKEAESIKIDDDTDVLTTVKDASKSKKNAPRAIDTITALEVFDEMTNLSKGITLDKNEEGDEFDTSSIDQVLVNEVLGEVMLKINIAMQNGRLEDEVESIRNYKGKGLAMYVRTRFLEMYAEINAIKETADYIAPNPINFMQKYFVWRMRQNNTFLNWSGTGCGKTRAALASMADCNAHVSLVVVPNAIIGSNSFKNELIRVYGNAYDLVIPEKASDIDTDYAERPNKTIILINYDKFSCASADQFVRRIAENHIDFINLDEVHMIKVRHESKASIRSSKIADLLCILRGNNPYVKVLAQSATPVINNMHEFKSIIETVYCEKIENMNDRHCYASIANAHRAYVLYGYGLTYETGIKVNERMIGLKLSEDSAIATEVKDIKSDNKNHCKRSELAVATLNAKLDWIVKNVRKGDIIYTKFQTGIADAIAERMNDNGISAVVYNGTTKSERAEGLCSFINGDIDVLIGGDCLTTGIDGLQNVSNRIIFVGLPDTQKDYEQLVGRIDRQGSKFNEVELVVLSVDIPRQKSEEKKARERLERKAEFAKIITTGNFKDNKDVNREMLVEETCISIENL